MKSTLKCVSGMASLCVHSFVIWGPLFLKREFFIPSEENIFSISSPFCQLSFRERIIAPLTKEGPRLTVFQLSIYFSNFKTQFEIVVYILAVIVLLSTSVLQILALWRYMLCSCLMDVFVYAVGEVHSEFLTFVLSLHDHVFQVASLPPHLLLSFCHTSCVCSHSQPC